ncbi:KorA protein [Burkholderia latens]
MTQETTPIPVPLESIDRAFAEAKVEAVAVQEIGPKQWQFVFYAKKPDTEEIQSFTLKTQRGEVRTWADPRNLFQWMQDRYGLAEGMFYLNSRSNNEK